MVEYGIVSLRRKQKKRKEIKRSHNDEERMSVKDILEIDYPFLTNDTLLRHMLR